MTSNTQILTAFNNHFEEFVDDIVRAFPDDIEIAAAANALKKLRKAKFLIFANKYDQVNALGANQLIDKIEFCLPNPS